MMTQNAWDLYIRGDHGASLRIFWQERDATLRAEISGAGSLPVVIMNDPHAAALFFKRAAHLVGEEAALADEGSSTMFWVRGVARSMLKALEAGEIEAIRATLQKYAAPEKESDA